MRLQMLRSLEVLDTPAEEVFDQITRLAATICECPISVLSFADENRHWFKSVYGTDETHCPREDSFCDHTLKKKSLLEVSDAMLDPRFKNNPYVVGELKLRFYAGHPLITKEGLAIGTLSLVSREPKVLTDFQRELLQVLGDRVIRVIEMRSLERTICLQSELLSKLHEQLVQQARLSTIGMMAGGIAHEVNNPLTVIIGRAQQVSRLMKTSSDPKKIDEAVEKIIETAKRVGQIVLSMRNLARDDSTVHQTRCELNGLIQETMDLCRSRFENHEVHIEWRPQDFENQFVVVNPVQFGQVLLNLLSNAFDAVKLSRHNKVIKLELNSNRENFEIDVIDSGPGVEGAVSNDIFTPFFTTKPLGEGTGLGLSLSKSMIEQNGGTLRFVSNSPTTFRITLKRAQESRLAA